MHYPRGINRLSRSRESRGWRRIDEGIEGKRDRESKRAKEGLGGKRKEERKRMRERTAAGRKGLPDSLLTIIRRAYVGKQRRQFARWKCII